MNGVEQGTEVILWSRMREDVIVLFGEGVYEGQNFVNGQLWPVVKLNNNREVTVHFQGVYVGTKDSVARTCANFPGVKLSFDLDAWLRGKRPTDEEIARLSQSTGAKVAQLPEPKTLTDKLMLLKNEIALEENKKKMFQQQIEECDKRIASKRTEAASLKAAVLKELEDLDAPVTPIVVQNNGPVQIVVEAPEPVQPYVPPPAQDAFDAEAKRAAIED